MRGGPVVLACDACPAAVRRDEPHAENASGRNPFP